MPVMIVGISVRCSDLNLVAQQPDGIAYMPTMQPGFVVVIEEFRHFYDLNTIRRSEADILLPHMLISNHSRANSFLHTLFEAHADKQPQFSTYFICLCYNLFLLLFDNLHL